MISADKRMVFCLKWFSWVPVFSADKVMFAKEANEKIELEDNLRFLINVGYYMNLLIFGCATSC